MRARAAWRPTREEIAAAAGRTVPDVVRPGLDVLFVGINPGLYSGAVGHHFARPGNRFWKALHLSEFTTDLLSPFDDRRLLDHGLGVTNLVARATPADHGLGITNLVRRATSGAAEVGDEELRAGGRRLRRKAGRLVPRFVAFLGVTAYRSAFGLPFASVGAQAEAFGPSRAWVLPNPSGLNAHYQLPALIEEFEALRAAVSASRGRAGGDRGRGGRR